MSAVRRASRDPVIGRSHERAEIEAFLDEDDDDLVLSIAGVAGIGKTVLWEHGLEVARRAGAVVLGARPSETESAFAFAGLTDLFDDVPKEVFARLPLPQRVALEGALLLAPMAEGGIDERALRAGVLSTIRHLAADRPVVVAIDDVQWLDAATAGILAGALRRLDATTARFLVTFRRAAPPSGSGAGAFDPAAPDSGRRVLEVGALDRASLHELIERRCGQAPARPLLVEIERMSAGNPLHALEIVGAGVRAHALDRGFTLPASVQELVELRVRDLSPGARRALLRASLLARPTAELVDDDALAEAEDIGMVTIDSGRIRFEHPLVASAVAHLATATERREIHRELAQRVPDPEEAARHAALAQLRPNRAIAGRLDDAAGTAHDRGAPGTAAELVELAISLTPSSDRAARDERRIVAAQHWLASGDLARAEALLDETLSGLAHGALRGRALQLLGQIHGRRASFAEASRVARLALDEVGADHGRRASLLLDLAYCSSAMGDLEQAAADARAAVEAAEAPEGSPWLADALGAETMATFIGGDGLDTGRLQRALRLAGSKPLVRVDSFVTRPRYVEGILQLWSGQISEADATLRALHVETIERGEEIAVPLLSMYLVWANLWAGDLRSASQLADEATEVATLLGDPMAEGISWSSQALVHAHQGRIELARHESAAALERFEALGYLLGCIWPRWALGLAELGCGNLEAVDAALGPLGDLLGTMRGDPVLGVFLPDEIEALVELGQLERAWDLCNWFDESARRLERRWATAASDRCKGLLLAAEGDLEAASLALGSSIERYEHLTLPFERARTLLVAGCVQRRRAKRSQARVLLAEALGEFERIGSPTWADRARTEIARLGARAPSPGTLSANEALVAELAAQGLSNREIADRAFLSVKTVEANLTRAYRKLGVRSRAGLGRARGLIESGSDPG